MKVRQVNHINCSSCQGPGLRGQGAGLPRRAAELVLRVEELGFTGQILLLLACWSRLLYLDIPLDWRSAQTLGLLRAYSTKD